MTDPLVDRDKIAAVIYGDGYLELYEPARDMADAVLVHLRSVLTPEALRTTEWMPGAGGQPLRSYPSTGTDLHRRIFGEDK